MKKKFFIISFITSLFVACHLVDYVRVGDYLYMNRTLSKIYYRGSVELINYVITEQILNWEYDNNFIVVYQIPDVNSERRESMRRYATESQLDSLDLQFEMMKRIHHCYWIIRLRDDAVFGPMTKADFQAKCKELGVKVEMDPKYESDFLKSLPLDSVRPSNIRCTGGGAQGGSPL